MPKFSYKVRLVVYLSYCFSATCLFVLIDFRSGANLAFVHLRRQGAQASEPLPSVRVSATSVFGSTVELDEWRPNEWELPGGLVRREIREIVIDQAQSENTTERGWELSLSMAGTRRWRAVEVEKTGSRWLVKCSPSRSILHLLRNRITPINWGGDGRLFGRSLVKSLLMVWGLGLCIRYARTCWSGSVACGSRGEVLAEELREVSSGWLTWRSVDAIVVMTLLVVLTYSVCQSMRVATRSVWPGLHDDACVYSSVALNLAAGQGSRFSTYSSGAIRSGKDRAFTGHGQLSPFLLSILVEQASWLNLMQVIHRINLVAFVISVLVWSVFFQRYHGLWPVASLGLALIISLATVGVMQYLQGRPEHWIPLVLLVAVSTSVIWPRTNASLLLSGLFIGLTAALSPLPGALYGVASVFTDPLFRTPVASNLLVMRVFMRALTALFSWAVVTRLCSDVSLGQLITDVLGSSGVYSNVWAIDQFSQFWLNHKLIPGLGWFFFMVPIYTAWVFVKVSVTRRWCPILICLCCLVILARFVWTNAIAYAGFHYSLIGFLPALLHWMLTPDALGRADDIIKVLRFRSIGLLMAIALSLLPCAIGSLRTLHLSVVALDNSWSLAEATQEIAEATSPDTLDNGILTDAYRNARSGVVFSGSSWRIWTSADDSKRSTVEIPRELGFNANYYVVLQWSEVPRTVSGFHLELDRYRRSPVYWGWWRISDYVPGYGFALYSRDEYVTAQSEEQAVSCAGLANRP